MNTKNITMTAKKALSKGHLVKAAAGVLMAAVVILGSDIAFAKINDGGSFNPNRDGGFIGLNPALSTVEQAKSRRADDRVRLRGYVVQRLDGETYLFEDRSGTVNVEISNATWNGQIAGPGELLEINGEINKSSVETAIEVRRLRKL